MPQVHMLRFGCLTAHGQVGILPGLFQDALIASNHPLRDCEEAYSSSAPDIRNRFTNGTFSVLKS